MASALSPWAKKMERQIAKYSVEELSTLFCFRDPARPIKHNSEIIYSPADGIIISQEEVSSCSSNLFSKYGNITLDDLSYSQIPDGEYLVSTIFLTFYDAHILRNPIHGAVSVKVLPAYYVENKPMLEFEEYLFKNVKNIDPEYVTKFAFNQRALFTINSTCSNKKIYLIVTGDYDIDTITYFFRGNNQIIGQNSRMASIRYGSMVTCVVPKSWDVDFAFEKMKHVETGIDPLFFMR